MYNEGVSAMKKTLNKIPALPLSHQLFWWICRGLILIWGTVMLFSGYTTEFLEAVFGIIFTHLWDLFQLLGGKTFITQIPYRLQTMLTGLLCFAIVVGTTINKFTTFDFIDIPEHFLSGYLATAGSYELAIILQGKRPTDKTLSPALAAMFAFAFGVTLLVGWEFYEFTMDRLYGLELQRSDFDSEAGLIDTMVDLIVGTAGSLLSMFVTAFSKNKKEKKEKKGKK